MTDQLSRPRPEVHYARKGTTARPKTKPSEEVLKELVQKLEGTSDLSEKVGMVSHCLGHPGPKKLYAILQPHRTEPGLKRIIEDQRKNCIQGQKNVAASTLVPKTQNLDHLSTSEPVKHICSDISELAELPRSTKKRWIITITDRGTRWTKIRRTTNERRARSLRPYLTG